MDPKNQDASSCWWTCLGQDSVKILYLCSMFFLEMKSLLLGLRKQHTSSARTRFFFICFTFFFFWDSGILDFSLPATPNSSQSTCSVSVAAVFLLNLIQLIFGSARSVQFSQRNQVIRGFQVFFLKQGIQGHDCSIAVGGLSYKKEHLYEKQGK